MLAYGIIALQHDEMYGLKIMEMKNCQIILFKFQCILEMYYQCIV
jgi:hypothetical protein